MIGQTLSHYQVLEKIGEGGMGEVYLAKDTKLDREVAVKVLPATFSENQERLARFEREARLLASLNHPNIAAIHELEESDGVHFLALEYVPGETLAERIKRGPIPIDDALPLFNQIAEGLEAAHEKGVIHRDLKPTNIKVTPEGKVKILDFGLAKAFAAETPGQGLSESPTITKEHTEKGVLLGTAPYMSPEQARGKVVDKRADVWAFGCCLFEALTGKAAFLGETVSDTISAILRGDLAYEMLPSDTPDSIRRLLRRCLAKDPRSRLRDIGDAWIEIRASADEGVDRTALAESSRAYTHLALGGLVGLVVGIVIGAVSFMRPSSSTLGGPLPQARFSFALPDKKQLQTGDQPESTLAISPDGSRIVYVGGEDWRDTRLFTRAIDSLEIALIPGTEGARQPFFSPDGRWLAFFNRLGELKKVSMAGGEPVTLLREVSGSSWAFGSWGDDGNIVFSNWTGGLKRISAEGGSLETLKTGQAEWLTVPEVLPRSQVVLYTAESEEGPQIVARWLLTGAERTLLEDASNPRYLGSGHLLFSRDGAPMIVGFDPNRVATSGPAVPVDENIRIDSPVLPSAIPLMAASTNGTLVFAPAVQGVWRGTLVWVDRQGAIEEIGPVPAISFLQLSPDGRRVALTFKQGRTARLEVLDLERKVSTPLYEAKSIIAMMPVWFPDGRHIASSQCGTTNGSLYRHGVGGGEAPELLMRADSLWGVTPWSIAPDGRYIAVMTWDPEAGSENVRFHPLGKDKESLDFLLTPASEIHTAFSPDGRWIAYTSNDSGTMEIYVREFPSGRNKRKVSAEGGWAPLWSPDGTEIFYQSEDGRRLMAVEIDTVQDLRISDPKLLLEGPFQRSTDIGYTYDVSPDGRRFLMMQVGENLGIARELIVVQNWFEELKRLVPAN